MSPVVASDKLTLLRKGRPMLRLATALLLTVFLYPIGSADASGLIWKLPEDGTAATFRGTYTQLVRRTDATQQNVDLSWTRVLTIRSVGSEQASYRGEMQPCRWLEFEQTTGEIVGGQVETGPGGRILVKVLVPEKLVLATVADDGGIPVAFIPIAQGWKQVDDAEPMPLTAEAIDLTPSVTLLGYPRSLSAGGEGGSVDVGTTRLATSQWTGSETMESSVRRTTSQTELWRSPDAPFGVAKWAVSIKLERKESTSSRSEFAPADEIREEMSLAEVTDGAVSKLNP